MNLIIFKMNFSHMINIPVDLPFFMMKYLGLVSLEMNSHFVAINFLLTPFPFLFVFFIFSLVNDGIPSKLDVRKGRQS